MFATQKSSFELFAPVTDTEAPNTVDESHTNTNTHTHHFNSAGTPCATTTKTTTTTLYTKFGLSKPRCMG